MSDTHLSVSSMKSWVRVMLRFRVRVTARSGIRVRVRSALGLGALEGDLDAELVQFLIEVIDAQLLERIGLGGWVSGCVGAWVFGSMGIRV